MGITFLERLDSMSDIFGVHPSKKLSAAYQKKYWQVQDPHNAQIIFLGLDANWDINIEANTDIFQEILEYLEDGVAYWKQKGYHHPFLSPNYGKRDGYTYHARFLKTGITSEYADDISFVELLSIPTYGMSSGSSRLFDSLLDENYLRELNGIIFNQKPKIVFMPKSVYEKINKVKSKLKIPSLFDFKTKLNSGENYSNKIMNIHSSDNAFIFVHTHFSNAISDNHLKNIGYVMRTFLGHSDIEYRWEVKPAGEKGLNIIAKDVFEVKNILGETGKPFELEVCTLSTD